jgi:hypothetical protein
MSWLFSRALVGAFSEATCSAGAQSALSSGKPTPRAFLPPAKMTDFSRLSRFGMTFGPLTDDLGAELLTWFLEASHARTSASPARETGLTESGQDCGQKWRGSLAKYDPDLRGWKTAQRSLLGDSEEFSETWPRWGTTVAGELYLLPTPELRTSGNVSGSWPTPNAQERGGRHKPGSHLTLTKAVQGWMKGRKGQNPDECRVWPTPVASMSKGSSPAALTRKSGRSRENDRLDHKVMATDGGQLHPTWVEWLMGWPLGWTDLKPLETDKSPSAQPLPGES